MFKRFFSVLKMLSKSILPTEELPLPAASKSNREYVSEGLTPERLAALLKEADEGNIASQIHLFDQMEEKDAHLQAEYGKRLNAIMEPEYDIEPFDESKESRKAAEFVEDVFSSLPMYDLYVALQQAVGRGFSAVELKWEMVSGKLIISGFEYIPQQFFKFDGKKPLLITENNLEGEELPPYKAVIHKYGGLSGDPRAPKIFRACAWLYLFKNYSLKDWVVFSEVYGMPLRLGKYPSGANDEQKKALKSALLSLASDGAGIIPQGADIELIFSSAKSGADVYERLAKFCEKGMSKVILGQTLSADVGEKGSYAAAKAHNEVREDILFADARALSETLKFQIIKPLIGFNFGWDTPLPRVIPRISEPEDLKTTAETYQILAGMGLKIPEDFIYGKFNIPKPEKDSEVIGGEQKPALKLALKQGIYTQDQQLIEDVVEKYFPVLNGTRSENLAKIEKLLNEAKDYEELKQGLNAIYPNLNKEAFSEILARLFFASEMWGRKSL